jgi:hypothetical protein
MTWDFFSVWGKNISHTFSEGLAWQRVLTRFRTHSPTRTVLAILPVLLLALPASEARATDTAWKLYERGATPAVARFAGGPHQILCGSYGVFEMEFDAQISRGSDEGPVPPLEEGREVPPDYPLLASGTPAGVYQRIRGGGSSSLFLSGKPAPPPCDRGGCFTTPGQEPWVAVVDWNNWHGWSVGWTILQSSNERVGAALFPLDDPTLTGFFGQRITDVHLLSELCEVAEILEQPAVEPPVAINLSFGRPRGIGDAADEQCDPSTLSCQILRVLNHLHDRSLELAPDRSNAPLVVAAAGNHRELLFPASLPGVVSVGALDLQEFHQLGRVDTSWETPREAQALFPGYGLCLEYPVSGQQAAWPAPPGSSYSTALMSGWLAPSLKTRRLPQGGGRWELGQSCWRHRCSLVAERGNQTYEKAPYSVQTLIDGTDAGRETACSSTGSGDEVTMTRSVGRPLSLSALPGLSFPEVTPALLRPTPEPASCVPCEERLNRSRNHVTSGQRADGTDGGLGVTFGAARWRRSESLTVRLWAGQPVDSDLVVAGLYLRVGDLLYPVDLTRSDLGELEAGKIDLLELDLGSVSLPKKMQPSLVWILRGPSTTRGEVEFWTSTPIVLRSQ